MGSTRYIRYKGNNPKLENGKSYTFKQYAEVAGVSYRCFCTRAQGKSIITDAELVPLNAHLIPKAWRNATNIKLTRLESYSEQVSQQWLQRKL